MVCQLISWKAGFRSARDVCGSDTCERKRQEAGVVRGAVRPQYKLTKISASANELQSKNCLLDGCHILRKWLDPFTTTFLSHSWGAIQEDSNLSSNAAVDFKRASWRSLLLTISMTRSSWREVWVVPLHIHHTWGYAHDFTLNKKERLPPYTAWAQFLCT